MRLALLGLIGMAFAAGVSAESFCDANFPPIMNEGLVQTTQATQLSQFLTVVVKGGVPNTPTCNVRFARRLLAAEVAECDDVTGLFGRDTTAQFFNGSKPDWRSPADNTPTEGNSLPDYTDDLDALSALMDRLTAFFGQKSALNCSMDTEFPAYMGRANQNDVHANMPIGEAAFNDFVGAVVDTALSYGISNDDITPVGALLNSFKRHTASPDENAATICNQDDCACAPEAGEDCKLAVSSSSSTGDDGGAASTVSVSFLAMAVAAVAALVRQ